jgi:hypothetical protein
MRDVDRNDLLTTTKRAEDRHIPVQADKPQQVFDKRSRLPQRHAEQDLHSQAGLDGSVTIDEPPPTLASRIFRPQHVRIEPDRQRPAPLERLVVLGPVKDLVARGCSAYSYIQAIPLGSRDESLTGFVKQSQLAP